MDLLERLRPRWRHSDPDVRAAAVREMGAHDLERLATIAGSDPDARVRRIALKKLEDPDLLARLAEAEADPALREVAAERGRELLVAIASSAGALADCEAAMSRLSDPRSLASVAMGGAHERVRRAALARTTGDRVLRDVVRGAADPAIRHEALDRIRDPAILRSIVVGDGPSDLALRALEHIDDAAALQAIAENRAAAKAVRQRARAMLATGSGERPSVRVKDVRARQLELSIAVHALRAERDAMRGAERVREAQREWENLVREVEPRDDVAQRFATACQAILDDAASIARRRTAADEARMVVVESLAARSALCERVEELDGAAALRDLEEARAAWGRLSPVPDEVGGELSRRFTLAVEGCALRHREWLAREGRRAELEAFVEEVEALAESSPLPTAPAWRDVEKRWASLEGARKATREVAPLERRFALAGERLERRRQQSEQRRSESRQENLARLEQLCGRLEELLKADTPRASEVRRGLQAANDALGDLGPLPPSERRAAWTTRLVEARNQLLVRSRQQEEAEEWRRWANAAAQEEIIRRVETLLESNDLAEGVRQLARLQEEWAGVASATPEKSQELWERFRAARNELRRRCDAYLMENLAKKRALCTQVAGLDASTDWTATADLIKRLQAEWSTIGSVPGRHTNALWQQFREPCDRFFTRRKEYFDRLDGERRENAGAKTALCEQAEALADSKDWEATATALKQLQAEWKGTGHVPRAEGEALWQRFRTACDRFFDRRSRREELAREEALARAQSICGEFESLATGQAGEDGSGPEDVARKVDEIWGEWLRLDLPTREDAQALAERIRVACERIAATQPESLRGTRLDPAVTRKRREKLCARLEELAGPGSGAPREMSLQEMALALRDRLATNTIAGATGGRSTRQDVAREVDRISASWTQLGPVLDADARGLAERFDRARASLRATSK